MLRATFFTCGIAASLAVGSSVALAQQFGGGGNSGFGGGGGGFGSGGGSAFGSSGFGSSGGGGSGFGSGTTGFSGFGGSGFGGGSSSFGGGFGNAFGSNGIGSGGGGLGVGGGQGFGGGMNGGGQGSQGGQQFIGRSNSDMQSMMKNLGKSSNQFFQQLNRTLGQNNRGKGEGQKENAKLTVPVKLNVAFDNTTPVSSALAGNVHTHLDKILVARKMPVPDITIDGDTVVLSGTADSDSQRLLIEKLVSLEPGVSQVTNQMTVAGSSPAATLPQPAGN